MNSARLVQQTGQVPLYRTVTAPSPRRLVHECSSERHASSLRGTGASGAPADAPLPAGSKWLAPCSVAQLAAATLLQVSGTPRHGKSHSCQETCPIQPVQVVTPCQLNFPHASVAYTLIPYHHRAGCCWFSRGTTRSMYLGTFALSKCHQPCEP